MPSFETGRVSRMARKIVPKPLTLAIGLTAVLLFSPLFIFRGFSGIDFWWWLSADIALLVAAGYALDPDGRSAIAADLQRRLPSKLLLGLFSAAFLYLIFFLGNIVSRALFPFAPDGIDSVYAFKAGAGPLRIGLLMALVIGPGEELFWRGLLQRRLQDEIGRRPGFAAAAAVYALVHLGSGNIMLVLAAAVCGVYWGLIYFKTGSMVVNVVSHTAWDLAVFLFFPLASTVSSSP